MNPKTQFQNLQAIATRLRKKSAYESSRSIIRIVAILCAILPTLAFLFAIYRSNGNLLPYVFALALPNILFWILVYQIGQAFFDLADGKLELLHRDTQAKLQAHYQTRQENQAPATRHTLSE